MTSHPFGPFSHALQAEALVPPLRIEAASIVAQVQANFPAVENEQHIELAGPRVTEDIGQYFLSDPKKIGFPFRRQLLLFALQGEFRAHGRAAAAGGLCRADAGGGAGGCLRPMTRLSTAAALESAMAEEMRRDPRVYTMSTSVSPTLLAEYGPQRVKRMPISEATMTGIAVGSAGCGFRPVVHWRSVTFVPGETTTVTLDITPALLSFYDVNMKYVVEPGDFSIMVGNSSRDADLQKLTLQVVR